MATIKISPLRTRQFGGAPYGNTSALPFSLTTNSAGAANNSNDATALAIGDKVVLGELPAGMRLDDSCIVLSTAMTASVTGSLGFEYADGTDSTSIPQDAAYFGAGIALSTAARLRNAASKAIVTLPKAANLVLTIAGANNAKVSRMDILVTGEMTGQP